MKLLANAGIPITPYPGFVTDPELGLFTCFVPDQPENERGPNGLDHVVGDILTLGVDGDHLHMLMPNYVHLLADNFEKILAHFNS